MESSAVRKIGMESGCKRGSDNGLEFLAVVSNFLLVLTPDPDMYSCMSFFGASLTCLCFIAVREIPVEVK